jgi:hypothetical protein
MCCSSSVGSQQQANPSMWGNNLYTPDDGTPIAYLRLVDIKSAEGLAYSVDYAAKDIAAIIIS